MTLFPSRRNIFSFETLFIVLLSTLLLWKGIIPAWKTLNTDFPNYYLVGRLLHEGYSLDHIYDWVWLQRIKDHWGIDQSLVGFAGLTPFSALPVVPLTVYSALTAKRIWIIINLLLLATSVELLRQSTTLNRRQIWLLTLLAIAPLRTSFLYGQMHICVLFLLVLAWFLYGRNQDVACGTCIALAGGLKVYPLLFLLLFLWKRQWRLVLSVLGATALMVILTGWWMGWDILRTYTTQILPRSVQGEVLDPYTPHAASAAAFFHRLFLYEPTLNPAPLLSSPFLYSIVYPLWQALILLPLLFLIPPTLSRRHNDAPEWATFLLALVVLSPVPSSYHYVVLIFPIVLLASSSLARNHRTLLTSLIAAYALTCAVDAVPIPTPLRNFAPVAVGFARLWFVIAFYILALIRLKRSRPAESFRPSRLHAGMLTLLALLIVVAGFIGYQKHFYRRDEEMTHRIQSPPAYLLTAPVPFRNGYLSVAMLAEGYRILNRQGDPLANPPELSDQLSFATDGKTSFVEQADNAGSRLIRVVNGSPVVNGSREANGSLEANGSIDRQMLTQDAELPTLSSDTETLAFIREDKGRGSLWVIDMAQPQTALRSPKPLINDKNYDVRGASFLHSGHIVFLAKHDDRAGLFQVAQDGLIQPWLLMDTDIGSFAISPGEDRIAYTQLVNHRWQLFIMRLDTRNPQQLTYSDCNAYAPAWNTMNTVLYASDCGRGLGLTAISSIEDRNTGSN